MLSDNIKILRKEKGYSQETLANKLHVVRQTVSKWEKGLSVPDAEMLNELADVLETPVDSLLGSVSPQIRENEESKTEEIAKQLAILNDQLAILSSQRRKTIKRVLLGLTIGFFTVCIFYVTCLILFRYDSSRNEVMTTTRIVCELDGETFGYEVRYDQNFRIHESGGDAWIANHVIAEKDYDDANVLLAQIEDYFTERGGTFKIIDEDN